MGQHVVVFMTLDLFITRWGDNEMSTAPYVCVKKKYVFLDIFPFNPRVLLHNLFQTFFFPLFKMVSLALKIGK